MFYFPFTSSILLIDADLLDGGTRFPNLALLKMSGFLKAHGHNVTLLQDFSHLEPDLFSAGWKDFDRIFLSQVFTKTKRSPLLDQLIAQGHVQVGGTGIYETSGPRLPDEVEHHMPDYHLYDEYIAMHAGKWDDYQKASIGFTTRGCFRKCPFCVNREYSRVVAHSPVAEFFDPSRPLIYLWDDNFMAANETLFFRTLEDLAATRKRFQYRQGLDIRLMTKRKAAALASARWYGDYIFAFDHDDEPTVKATLKGLEKWRETTDASTKLYVLSGWEADALKDFKSVFFRIEQLFKYRCIPYLTRHENYKQSPHRWLYTALARWCNQPALVRKKSFFEYTLMDGNQRLNEKAEDFLFFHPEFEEAFHLKYQ